MFWYIVLLSFILLIFYLCLFAKQHGFKMVKSQIVWLCSVPMLIMMAFRSSSVGIDTIEFVRAFSQIKDYNLVQTLTRDVYGAGSYKIILEPGYRIFNWVTGLISKNDQAIIVTGSLLVIILLTILSIRESYFPVLSVLLYLTLGIFQTHMNVSRNAMAIFISYYGIRFIRERRPIKYLLCLLIGISFHTSVILLLPLYWLVNYVRFNNRRFQKVLFGVAVLVAIFPLIKNILIRIVPTIYRGYFLRETEDFSSLLVGILYLILFAVCILMTRRGERYSSLVKENVGTWMLILNTSFFALSLSLGNAARAAAIFGPYIVFYIPNLLNRTKYKNTATIIIVILCIIAYIARMSINNIGRTLPFQFCF